MTNQIFICKDTKNVGVLYSGTGYVIISKGSKIRLLENVNEWGFKLLSKEPNKEAGHVIKRVFGEIEISIPKNSYDPNEIVYELKNSCLAFTFEDKNEYTKIPKMYPGDDLSITTVGCSQIFAFEDKNEYTKIPKMYPDDDLSITTVGCSQIFIEDSHKVTITKQIVDERTLATCEFRFNVYPDENHQHVIESQSGCQIIIKAATLPLKKKPFECPKCSHETYDSNEFVLVNKRMICKNCL
jgi:hypothetical protein